jgi:hypothetical protein
MTLQRFRIVHVKGIQNQTFLFGQGIPPNKPSLLYAPNGFGKSSLAIAFDSLNNNRLDLHKENCYTNDETLPPLLEIRYQKPDYTVVDLQADSATNTIKNEFDVFVINNQVRAKTTPMKLPGKTVHSASLHIDSFVLINNIPPAAVLGYGIQPVRARFGANGKILPNLFNQVDKAAFLTPFYKQLDLLDKFGQKRIGKQIQDFKDRVNNQNGNIEALLDWIEANELATLDGIAPLKILTDQLMGLDLGFTRRSERVLAVLEMMDLYHQGMANFKSACERRLYEVEKDSYVTSFKAFNSTWKDIRPKEKNGQLVIEFPKAHHISNGQRDILCLVAMLEVARRKMKKGAAILIIDEVFDYLDEANLVAAQYYVSEFISEFKKSGRKLYPLILTHLNPKYFAHYSFSKMKDFYLDQRTSTVSASMAKLIELRENPTIYTDVSMYLLHYHTGQINCRPAFQALGLRPTWGEGTNFVTYITGSINDYLTNRAGFDPFAVCCAVRRRVEEKIYNAIGGAPEKVAFLVEHGTKEKLHYARTLGVVVPEYYYLLGIIYNDGMHWKAGRDNESPLKVKLENGTIRKLIADVFK